MGIRIRACAVSCEWREWRLLEGGGYAARERMLCGFQCGRNVCLETESRREWSVEGPVEGRGGIGVCANEATTGERPSVCQCVLVWHVFSIQTRALTTEHRRSLLTSHCSTLSPLRPAAAKHTRHRLPEPSPLVERLNRLESRLDVLELVKQAVLDSALSVGRGRGGGAPIAGG